MTTESSNELRTPALRPTPLLHTHLSDPPSAHQRYGSQRLWGAVGFGIASLVAGYVCDLYGGRYYGVMLVFVACILVALVASTGVPVGQQHSRDEGAGSG